MAGRDSTNRLGEGTVGAPPDGIDYVDALPGCCQRPRRGGRSRRSRFGHLRRCVFGATGTYLALACMVSNIIRAPAHVGDRLRVGADVAERHLTIVECRRRGVRMSGGSGPGSRSRLRYTKAARQWSLYWRDRNLRFHDYDRVRPTESVEDLLAEVDRDPTVIFWG